METRTLKSKIGIYMLLSVLAVLVVIPFGWMLLASVKTSNEVFSIPMKLFPKEFQWVNYQTIWDKIPLLVFFKNTFKIAVCTTLLQVLTSCFAAYGFSKVEFKGRDFLFLVSVTTFAVPWQAYMVQDGPYGFPSGADSDAGFFRLWRVPNPSVYDWGAQRASGGGQDRRSIRVWDFREDCPAPCEARHRNPGDLHICKYLE